MNPDEPTTADRPPGDDSGEDYSYDLAHEVPESTRPDPARQRAARPRDPEPSVGPDGDYSYDLAHEVPRQGG